MEKPYFYKHSKKKPCYSFGVPLSRSNHPNGTTLDSFIEEKSNSKKVPKTRTVEQALLEIRSRNKKE